MAAIVTLRRRTRCASRMTPSSTRSTTTTVTLSWPPAASAASTRLSTQICAVEDCVAMFSISLSGIMLERPSEHRIRRSPSSICRVKWSAYMAGSGAQRTGDDRTVGVDASLVCRDLAGVHELLHVGVVAGHADERALVEQIGARVAHVGDGERVVFDVAGWLCSPCRACPGRSGPPRLRRRWRPRRLPPGVRRRQTEELSWRWSRQR